MRSWDTYLVVYVLSTHMFKLVNPWIVDPIDLNALERYNVYQIFMYFPLSIVSCGSFG